MSLICCCRPAHGQSSKEWRSRDNWTCRRKSSFNPVWLRVLGSLMWTFYVNKTRHWFSIIIFALAPWLGKISLAFGSSHAETRINRINSVGWRACSQKSCQKQFQGESWWPEGGPRSAHLRVAVRLNVCFRSQTSQIDGDRTLTYLSNPFHRLLWPRFMTIVVPQGGADQYLMKKYRTKDCDLCARILNLMLTLQCCAVFCSWCWQEELMDFASWIDTCFPASGRPDAFKIYSDSKICSDTSNWSDFKSLFAAVALVQDRIQSWHERRAEILATLAVVLSFRLWIGINGRSLRHVYFDGANLDSRVSWLWIEASCILSTWQASDLTNPFLRCRQLWFVTANLQVQDRCQWRRSGKAECDRPQQGWRLPTKSLPRLWKVRASCWESY